MKFELVENDIIDKIEKTSDTDVLNVLNNVKSKNLNDFITLISPAAEKYLEFMAQTAARIKQQKFGKTIKLYCPIYVSNKCVNSCIYCGFNIKNEISRKTLSLEEIEAEAGKIKKYGFDSILIVSGAAPAEINIEYLLAAVKILKKYFSYIAIEIEPLTEEEYKALVNAGVDGLTLYQETYNKEKYALAHLFGNKKKYDYRLDALERGANAGIRELTCGVLLGLYDWRIDTVFMVMHAKYLIKKCWRSRMNFSFPRIRPSASGFNPPFPVNDKNLTQLISALRICFPDSGLSLSTRESSEFRDNLINIGITHISAGSKTNPGGYNEIDSADEQFTISDKRQPAEIAEILNSKGIDVVWKDWDNNLKIV